MPKLLKVFIKNTVKSEVSSQKLDSKEICDMYESYPWPSANIKTEFMMIKSAIRTLFKGVFNDSKNKKK